MTRDDVTRWLDGYIDAWMTYDPDRIRALFSEDAEYRYHPWDEPVRGREAIVADWLDDPDAPGTYIATYGAWAVDGTRARGHRHEPVRRPHAASATYHNVFLIEFDDAGLCQSFTEVFLQEPDRA